MKPMWMYSGLDSKMRLHLEDNDKEAVDVVLSTLFINPVVPAVEDLPLTLWPLHQLNMTERLAILDGMPAFTLAGEKETPVPVVQEVEAAESPSAPGAGRGEEEATANPSAVEVSSSRAGAFTDKVCEISSGDDDAFVVAPSRLMEEEEDVDDEAAAEGRREPRSKAAFDRPGARPSDVPSKRKAEAPPEGSGTKAKPSWRSPGLAWVDTGAKQSG